MFLNLMKVIVCSLILSLIGCDSEKEPKTKKRKKSSHDVADHKDSDKEKKKGKKHKPSLENSLLIVEEMKMPPELKEISGLSWMKNNLAAVQDEMGIIYLLNPDNGEVIEEIPFAGKGDFEGVASAKGNFFVITGAGILAEVSAKGEVINSFRTGLNTANNPEGVFYDTKTDRLLIALKGESPDEKNTKHIYAFDLKSGELADKPIYKIDLTHEIFSHRKKNRSNEIFQPSDLTIHPQTGEIYIVDGAHPALLILDPSGQPRRLLELDKKTFLQPEGITFDPQGNLFISSEGVKEHGKIFKVQLKSQNDSGE